MVLRLIHWFVTGGLVGMGFAMLYVLCKLIKTDGQFYVAEHNNIILYSEVVVIILLNIGGIIILIDDMIKLNKRREK